MSGHLLRRNSSKEGLQNLLRVTAQRSIEDAEEIERERRRRARERQGDQDPHTGPASTTSPTPDNGLPELYPMCESEVKASGCQLALEEDEGFSDWTQRLEKRRQRHLEEQESSEDHQPQQQQNQPQQHQPQQHQPQQQHHPQQQHQLQQHHPQQHQPQQQQQPQLLRLNRASPIRPCLKTRPGPGPEEREEKEVEWERKASNKTQDTSRRVTDDKVVEKKKSELKISYTSKVMRHVNSNGEAAGAEVTSYLVAGKLSPSRSGSLGGQRQEEVDGEVPGGQLETEKTPGQGQGTLEQLRQRQQEDQEEMEELNRRVEEKRRAREEEEHQREKEEQHRQEQEEEERKRVKDGIESRRMAASERRMKNLSISSIEGDESFSPFSPMSPTFKINDRTESLNRSLQKSNSIKKTQPPIPISKIDNRLEQYTHAIETSSMEAKAARQQALTDLPSPTEPVASKKNLFEAGEAWSQPPRETPSKDTEGLNVGVADLIHQWVKGNPDGSCKSPSKPAEVKAGDVLSKKNLWENLGDSSPSGRAGKGASSGKKYKFVMMAHGKYEKVAVGDDDYNEHTNGKSTGQCLEEL
ncbi:non-muscle caldesmon-like isoform X3 [Oncorhynchus kisutch]|uniref:non-muscle caldesmon-like isoform X3 n=1 Tax=Oncorhynchus kisutch TaxID=8019 RepID=UPI0012DEF7DE|nr:non-muscle caldesmon-like isoform X3 [Oncorhynchus kisutch]